MERKLSYIITENIRTEQFLRRMGFSRHIITVLKQYPDGLTLQGSQIFSTHILAPGDTLQVCLREVQTTETVTPIPLPLSLLYEDEDLVIIDKPAGMAVHPSQGNRENTVANALAFLYAQRGEPFVFRPIGRLDKNTSGLLLLAKNALSACRMIASGYRRTYLALCTGDLAKSGSIVASIGRAESSTIRREIRADGAPAVTHFERLQTNGRYSLARVWLDTGRTHQIRVHFAHIGHPLCGDFLYGTELPALGRHALHAAELTLTHPITAQTLSVSSALPIELQSLMQ